MSVKISSKYQVVIPEAVREALNFKPGAIVDVIAKGGIAYIVPVKSLKEIKGSLAGKIASEDVRSARQKKDKRDKL